MDLIKIVAPEFSADISLAYATTENFTGKPIYENAICYLHIEAAKALKDAIESAENLGYRIRIYDGFRPSEAQWVLWNHTPDPTFLADPRRGSPHSRGIAVDLTLIDETGKDLEMGTSFDTFHPKSHHGSFDVSPEAQRNRHLLMGIMTLSGWDFYQNEWWHYQLFDSQDYPLLSDSVLLDGLMPPNTKT